DQEKTALAALSRNLKAQQAALGKASGLSTAEQLIALGQLNGLLQQQLTTTDQLTTNQQQLALARDVEAPQITTFAAATKTTARSRRNTVIVAALIGLLLGIVAALVYDTAVRRVRTTRRPGRSPLARGVRTCWKGSAWPSWSPRTTRRS